jgi:toxin CcdB
MEQYFAYENEGKGKTAYPWLINMQHPVANVMKHVLVAPAVELSHLEAFSRLRKCALSLR